MLSMSAAKCFKLQSVWCRQSCSFVLSLAIFVTPPIGEQPAVTNRCSPAAIRTCILAAALSKEVMSSVAHLLIGNAESRYRFGTGRLAH